MEIAKSFEETPRLYEASCSWVSLNICYDISEAVHTVAFVMTRDCFHRTAPQSQERTQMQYVGECLEVLQWVQDVILIRGS